MRISYYTFCAPFLAAKTADVSGDVEVLPAAGMKEDAGFTASVCEKQEEPEKKETKIEKKDAFDGDASGGSRFKMSLYSRVRPKKTQLEEIKG